MSCVYYSSTTATHRLVTVTVWCDDCQRWHFRLSLQRRSASSSERWEQLYTRVEAPSQEWLEHHLSVPLMWSDLTELQRLFVEEQAGVIRLF